MIPLSKKYEEFIPQVNFRKKIRSKTVRANPKACILSIWQTSSRNLSTSGNNGVDGRTDAMPWSDRGGLE